MVLESRSEPVDRIERSRRDVIERSPVVRDEVAGLESLEQNESIGAGQMPFRKPVSTTARSRWEEAPRRDSAGGNQVILHEVRGVIGQSRSPAKKAEVLLVSIDTYSPHCASDLLRTCCLVHRRGRSNSDVIDIGHSTGCDWHRVVIALLPQPLGNSGRCEQGDVPG